MFIANRRDGGSSDDFALKSALARQELEADKCLLKIIQTACKAENLQAAFDATLLLSLAQSLAAAGKIAAFHRLPALEKRIALAAAEKSLTREEREHNQRELKWTHRVDERIIPAQAPASRSAGEFSTGPKDSTPRQPRREQFTFTPRIPPSAPSSREARRRLVIEQSTQGFGGSDGMEDGDEEMTYGSMDEEDRSPERHRSEDAHGEAEDDMVDEPESMIAHPPASAPKAKGLFPSSAFYDSEQRQSSQSVSVGNPFKKKAPVQKAPPQATSANLVGKGAAAKASGTKRTNSFFDRIDDVAPKGAISYLPGFPLRF